MAVKLADAGSVMPAYHDIDGESCHASRRLLTDILREQWGFDGLVVADYGGRHASASPRMCFGTCWPWTCSITAPAKP